MTDHPNCGTPDCCGTCDDPHPVLDCLLLFVGALLSMCAAMGLGLVIGTHLLG